MALSPVDRIGDPVYRSVRVFVDGPLVIKKWLLIFQERCYIFKPLRLGNTAKVSLCNQNLSEGKTMKILRNWKLLVVAVCLAVLLFAVGFYPGGKPAVKTGQTLALGAPPFIALASA